MRWVCIEDIYLIEFDTYIFVGHNKPFQWLSIIYNENVTIVVFQSTRCICIRTSIILARSEAWKKLKKVFEKELNYWQIVAGYDNVAPMYWCISIYWLSNMQTFYKYMSLILFIEMTFMACCILWGIYDWFVMRDQAQ